MAVAGRAEELALVDAFLAEEKSLSGAPPEFGPKAWGKGSLWEAIWPIADVAGIVEGGSLRVNYSPASDKPFSLILIFRDQCIYRLDFVDNSICHSNPFWAESEGAEPIVCGPHVHPWDMNRAYILRQDLWDLPCRIALQQQIRRFDQAFFWFADQVNLILKPDDRRFDLPAELV